MMPMPPTTSEIEATAASRSAITGCCLRRSWRLAEVANIEILRLAGRRAVARSRVVVISAMAAGTSLEVFGLGVDLVDVARKPRRHAERIGRRRIGRVQIGLLRGRRGNAEHLPLPRRERDHRTSSWSCP